MHKFSSRIDWTIFHFYYSCVITGTSQDPTRSDIEEEMEPEKCDNFECKQNAFMACKREGCYSQLCMEHSVVNDNCQNHKIVSKPNVSIDRSSDENPTESHIHKNIPDIAPTSTLPSTSTAQVLVQPVNTITEGERNKQPGCAPLEIVTEMILAQHKPNTSPSTSAAAQDHDQPINTTREEGRNQPGFVLDIVPEMFAFVQRRSTSIPAQDGAQVVGSEENENVALQPEMFEVEGEACENKTPVKSPYDREKMKKTT